MRCFGGLRRLFNNNKRRQDGPERERAGGCFLGRAFGQVATAMSFVQRAELQRRAEGDWAACAAALNKASEEGAGTTEATSRHVSDATTRLSDDEFESGYVSDLSAGTAIDMPVNAEAAAAVPAPAPAVDPAMLLQAVQALTARLGAVEGLVQHLSDANSSKTMLLVQQGGRLSTVERQLAEEQAHSMEQEAVIAQHAAKIEQLQQEKGQQATELSVLKGEVQRLGAENDKHAQQLDRLDCRTSNQGVHLGVLKGAVLQLRANDETNKALLSCLGHRSIHQGVCVKTLQKGLEGVQTTVSQQGAALADAVSARTALTGRVDALTATVARHDGRLEEAASARTALAASVTEIGARLDDMTALGKGLAGAGVGHEQVQSMSSMPAAAADGQLEAFVGGATEGRLTPMRRLKPDEQYVAEVVITAMNASLFHVCKRVLNVESGYKALCDLTGELNTRLNVVTTQGNALQADYALHKDWWNDNMVSLLNFQHQASPQLQALLKFKDVATGDLRTLGSALREMSTLYSNHDAALQAQQAEFRAKTDQLAQHALLTNQRLAALGAPGAAAQGAVAPQP